MIDRARIDVDRPRVLVLMATRNGVPWLTEQISSLLSQESVDLKVLVSDDASTDGTLDVLRASSATDPRITVEANLTRSGSAGANFRRLFVGADAEGADYVALADQDDVWAARKLISAIDAIRSSNAGGYSSAVEAFWNGDGRRALVAQSNRSRAADFLFEGAGQGCTFVLTGDTFRRAQAFCRMNRSLIEGLHYHDWLLYLLVRAWSLPWHFDHRPWMRYRQHGENEIGARGGLRAIQKRLGLIAGGWYGGQVRAACHLYRAAGGANPRAGELCRVLLDVAKTSSSWRRVVLAMRVVRDGRRRLSDRAILALCALAGKL